MMHYYGNKYQGWGIAALRIVVGIVFLMHGGQKLFVYGPEGVAGGFAAAGIPAPLVSAVLVTGIELLGGLMLVLGLFTRLAAVPLAAVMAVAGLAVHLKGGFFAPNGYEYVLTLFAANVALALAGAGEFALDNLRASRTQTYAPQRA